MHFSAWTVKKVCSPLESIPIDLTEYKHLEGLKLADKYPRNAVTIDLLIGSDQWSQIMLEGIRKDHVTMPVAMNSVFGWLVSGCIDSNSRGRKVITSLANLAVVRVEEESEEGEWPDSYDYPDYF